MLEPATNASAASALSTAAAWARKRLFLIAAVVFTVSSLACSLAPNIYVLIIFRVLQALGGGVFLPCATGIVSDAFGDRRATAIGLFTSIFPLVIVTFSVLPQDDSERLGSRVAHALALPQNTQSALSGAFPDDSQHATTFGVLSLLIVY